MTLEEFRQQKNDYFRTTNSPLTDEQRSSFQGLKYFAENAALRFELPLDEEVAHDELEMQTSTGDHRKYQRAGKISFQVNGETVSLTVFQSPSGYFLPFRDGSCEDQSYGAGRYLEPARLENGLFYVDFNLAYNPYCAYNERYSCPIPPRENWTKTRIEAGEQRFHE